MAGLRPEDVANNPWLRDTNPIIDMLVRYFQKTPVEVAKPGLQHKLASGEAGKKMAETKGPVKAETAKKAAKDRKRLTDQIP